MDFDARPELPQISRPTLIIGGGQNRVVGREAATELRQSIPNSEIFIYPALGHAAFEEAKDFNDRGFDFIVSA